MNINNLQFSLQEALAQVTNTTDYLLLAKTIKTLDVGQIRTVATFANLPSAAENEGLLVFVAADERLYWSTGVIWYYLTQTIPSAWTWGLNNGGQLGDNTITNRCSPVSVVGGFTDWTMLSAGDAAVNSGGTGHFTAGIRTNGTAWTWGINNYGQLGDSTTVSKRSPISVIGGFTDWCQISAGTGFALGVRANGTAWGWGINVYGVLGDGTIVNKSSPVSIIGGFTDWCQVSARKMSGYYGRPHSLGLRSNGTAWAWGYNGFGRLGNGTTINRSSPVSVVGGFTDWCQLSAGYTHNLGVRTNGTAWAWGVNDIGQLGNGTTINRCSPVSVIGGFTDWCQVSAGESHSLGLRTNGSVWSWGSGVDGKLGDGTTVNKSSPVSIVGGFTNWCEVSASYSHSVGIRSNGTMWSWGNNLCGRLGDGTTVCKSSPVAVVGGFTDWYQIDAGAFHSAAIRKTAI